MYPVQNAVTDSAQNMRALQLPGISRAMMILCNLVSQRHCAARLPIPDEGNCEVSLTALPFTPVSGALVISGLCRGHQIDIVVDELFARSLLGEPEHTAQLPHNLLIALVQQRLDKTLEQLERLLSAKLAIVNVRWQSDLTEKSLKDRLRLSVHVAGEYRHTNWSLLFDHAFAAWLGDWLKTCLPCQHNDCLQLPLLLPLVIARTQLKVEQLSQLRVNDIVLFDRCYSRQQQLHILLNQNCGFLVNIENEKLIVITAMEDTMSEVPVKDSETTGGIDAQQGTSAVDTLMDDNLIDTEQLTVTLEFLIGELPVTLLQLQQLRPGYVFDLAVDLSAPVTVKANGRVIGRCSLVDIEQRVGAQLTELFINNNKQTQ